MALVFRYKDGTKIPAEHFENDPGPPGPPAMSPEALAEFDRKTRDLKEAAERLRRERAKT